MKEKLDRRSKLQGLNSSRLIKFTDEDREMIKGTFDYFSLNHYTAYLSKAASKQDLSITYYTDSETEKSQDPSWPSGFSPWLKVF